MLAASIRTAPRHSSWAFCGTYKECSSHGTLPLLSDFPMLKNALLILLSTTVLLFRQSYATSGIVRILDTTILGQDPQTVNRLNGESFQQDPLVSFNGYQYAVWWQVSATNASVRHATVSRRHLKAAVGWEHLVLADYNQTEDDGHDMCVPSDFSAPLVGTDTSHQHIFGNISWRWNTSYHIRSAR
jgi:hypothetical protein